jgi:hypothetical protein
VSQNVIKPTLQILKSHKFEALVVGNNHVAFSFGLATEVTRIKIWAKDMCGVNGNVLGKRIEKLQNQLGTS